MKYQTKRFIAYLNILNVKIDSSKFEDRIKAQKLAYIIQSLIGKPLYEDFNFYIKGPYSPELAKEYFNFKDEFIEGKTNFKLIGEDKDKIEKASLLLNNLSLTELEIIGSLIYLLNKGFDENQAEAKLKELKQYLKWDDIWRGMNIVKKLFLTERLRKELMSSLENEISDWDRISDESLKKFE